MAPGDAAGSNTELLISKDAPDHIKLRKLVNKGFTPRRVADLADRLRERTDSIIDGLADRGGCDLVHDLALWLPLHVIADMVGVPEEDRQQVFDWTELTFGFDPDTTAEDRAQALMDMFLYADGLASEREKEPKDDLMSVLLEAEVDGREADQAPDRGVLHAAAERRQRDHPEPDHDRHAGAAASTPTSWSG